MEVKKRLAYSDKKNTRTKEVDIVRGLTIVLMVATHFAYSPLLISKLGNTLCFTIFLMLFGFSLYVSVIKHGNHRNIRYKIIKRVGLLLLAYYFVAFISLLSEPKSVSRVIQTLTFSYSPILTEFILTFIFYTALLPLAFYKLRFVFTLPPRQEFGIFGIIGILSYILGTVLNKTLSQPSILAFLGGYKSYSYFPLLQYLIVVLIGILYARYIETISVKIMHKVIILEMLTVILVSLIFPHKLAQLFTPEERFPPTILFIGLGTSVGFGLLLLARSLKFEKASKIIETLGKNSLGIYVFHIAILKLLNYKTFITITGPMEKTFMFGFLLFGYFPVNSAAQLVSVKLLKIGYFKLLGKRLKQAIT